MPSLSNRLILLQAVEHQKNSFKNQNVLPRVYIAREQLEYVVELTWLNDVGWVGWAERMAFSYRPCADVLSHSQRRVCCSLQLGHAIVHGFYQYWEGIGSFDTWVMVWINFGFFYS